MNFDITTINVDGNRGIYIAVEFGGYRRMENCQKIRNNDPDCMISLGILESLWETWDSNRCSEFFMRIMEFSVVFWNSCENIRNLVNNFGTRVEMYEIPFFLFRGRLWDGISVRMFEISLVFLQFVMWIFGILRSFLVIIIKILEIFLIFNSVRISEKIFNSNINLLNVSKYLLNSDRNFCDIGTNHYNFDGSSDVSGEF